MQYFETQASLWRDLAIAAGGWRVVHGSDGRLRVRGNTAEASRCIRRASYWWARAQRASVRIGSSRIYLSGR